MKYSIVGPDVSFYQDDPGTPRGIDFSKMKAAGAQFAVIRAGQNLWEDRIFDVSWTNSKGDARRWALSRSVLAMAR